MIHDEGGSSSRRDEPVVAAGNAGQAEAWNGDDGRRWVAQLKRRESMLAVLTPHLLDALRLTEGSQALDVGCGCGGTTLEIARRVTRGYMLGVDLSEPMLARARERATAEGLTGGHPTRVRFERGDAQIRPFEPASFDIALSRFGVMFFADPAAAFANIARALRPGGQLAFLCWRAMGENEFFTVPLGAIAQHLTPPEPAPPGEPGPFSLADSNRIRHLLDDAGFTEIEIAPVDERMLMGTDVEDAVAYLLTTPIARSLISSVSDKVRGRVTAALRDALEPHQVPAGVMLAGAAWLVTAARH